MKIEIIEGFPQHKENALSKLHPWLLKHHLFVCFIDYIDDNEIKEFIETPEEAKELAQELQHAVNKLLHWIEKREEED